MGNAESRRQSTTPSIQVQPPEQKFLSAHHPEKPGKNTGSSNTVTTPAKIHLDIPTKSRRKSLDTAFEEISKSLEDANGATASVVETAPVPSLLSPHVTTQVDKKSPKILKTPKSPMLAGIKKFASKPATSDFNLPMIVPGWFDSLPLPNAIAGRRSRRQSAEQGPISMKPRPFVSSDSWDDGLKLPKIPPHEIFAPPIEEDEEEEQEPRMRGRSNTIGNGQIPRLARAPSKEEVAKNDKVKVSYYHLFVHY